MFHYQIYLYQCSSYLLTLSFYSKPDVCKSQELVRILQNMHRCWKYIIIYFSTNLLQPFCSLKKKLFSYAVQQ